MAFMINVIKIRQIESMNISCCHKKKNSFCLNQTPKLLLGTDLIIIIILVMKYFDGLLSLIVSTSMISSLVIVITSLKFFRLVFLRPEGGTNT